MDHSTGAVGKTCFHAKARRHEECYRAAVKRQKSEQAPIVVDAETSARMGRIRQRDTAAEQLLRRWMWHAGYRYVTHNRRLPGRPDISNTNRRWAIFVHGCFWHGHQGCPRATTPKRNSEFWRVKIAENIARDARKERALRELGFEVFTIWECQLGELSKSAVPGELSFRLPPLPRPDPRRAR